MVEGAKVQFGDIMAVMSPADRISALRQKYLAAKRAEGGESQQKSGEAPKSPQAIPKTHYVPPGKAPKAFPGTSHFKMYKEATPPKKESKREPQSSAKGAERKTERGHDDNEVTEKVRFVSHVNDRPLTLVCFARKGGLSSRGAHDESGADGEAKGGNGNGNGNGSLPAKEEPSFIRRIIQKLQEGLAGADEIYEEEMSQTATKGSRQNDVLNSEEDRGFVKLLTSLVDSRQSDKLPPRDSSRPIMESRRLLSLIHQARECFRNDSGIVSTDVMLDEGLMHLMQAVVPKSATNGKQRLFFESFFGTDSREAVRFLQSAISKYSPTERDPISEREMSKLLRAYHFLPNSDNLENMVAAYYDQVVKDDNRGHYERERRRRFASGGQYSDVFSYGDQLVDGGFKVYGFA
jgi:hypothetical protein